MNHPTSALVGIAIYATALLVSISLITGCAELDRLTKPRVEGLQKTRDFNSASLTASGFSNAQVISSLAAGEINTAGLEPMLDGAIRSKRPDLAIGPSGRYQVTANVIANDVSHRDDQLDKTFYKWSSRRIKVSYVVVDTSTEERVWSGIIETSDEQLASYEKKKKKSSDKVLDAIAAAISKEEQYPSPNPPFISDVVKRNFEGFALNLPHEK